MCIFHLKILIENESRNYWVCQLLPKKMKFSIKDFFSYLRIWSRLLKKSLMENFIFCTVITAQNLSVLRISSGQNIILYGVN